MTRATLALTWRLSKTTCELATGVVFAAKIACKRALGQGTLILPPSPPLRQCCGDMATGHELGLARLRARRQPWVSEDGDSSSSLYPLERDREAFKRDHPLPPLLPSERPMRRASGSTWRRLHRLPRSHRHPQHRRREPWWSPTATCSRTPSIRAAAARYATLPTAA